MNFQINAKTGQTADHNNTLNRNHSKNFPTKSMDSVLKLHSVIGNKAVGQFVQTKLTIGAPNDKYEQEADRVADQVMRMPDSRVKHRETVSQLQMQPMEEEEEMLQGKAADSGGLPVSNQVQLQINNLRGGGHPLPESVRGFFEPRFGYDFSDVRTHTDAQAVATAKTINAKAFTVGRDVAFGAGQYSPETKEGKKLLAHELTHVVQQRGNGSKHLQSKQIIQRKRELPNRYTNSQGSWLQLDIPDGTYVLEALNMPCKVSHHARVHPNIKIYATAGQYTPREVNGLDAVPHLVVEDKSRSSNVIFRVVPNKEHLISKAGEGTAKVQVYDKHFTGDTLKGEVKQGFDTVPLVETIGEAQFLGSKPDLFEATRQYRHVGKGGSAGRSELHSITKTHGFSLSKSHSVTTTISSEISSNIGVDLKIVEAGVGSKISASESVTQQIQQSISESISGTVAISGTNEATTPGWHVFLPTAKVWRSELTVNKFDSTGKSTGKEKMDAYAFKYDDGYAHYNVADDGKTILDNNGNPLPNQ